MDFSKIRLKNKAYHQYLISKDQDDFFVSTKHGKLCRKAVLSYEHSPLKEVKNDPKSNFDYLKSK